MTHTQTALIIDVPFDQTDIGTPIKFPQISGRASAGIRRIWVDFTSIPASGVTFTIQHTFNGATVTEWATASILADTAYSPAHDTVETGAVANFGTMEVCIYNGATFIAIASAAPTFAGYLRFGLFE